MLTSPHLIILTETRDEVAKFIAVRSRYTVDTATAPYLDNLDRQISAEIEFLERLSKMAKKT